MRTFNTRIPCELPATARSVSAWLINYYSISRGNELAIYWGLPCWVNNHQAVRMWIDQLMLQPRPEGRTLGDVRRMLEERLPF